ncbi:hypothetical protein [Providencia rettgeri]
MCEIDCAPYGALEEESTIKFVGKSKERDAQEIKNHAQGVATINMILI